MAVNGKEPKQASSLYLFWAKQAATGHYFAGASLVPPGFSTAQDDCDNGWSQTFLQCRHIPVEIGLGYARLMGSKPLTTAVMVGMSTEPHRTWNTAGQIAVLREAVWRWMLGEGEVNVTICQSARHHRKSYRRKGESPPARSGWPRGGCDCSFTSPPRLQKSRRDRGGGSTSPLIQLFVKCLPLSRNRIRKVKFKVTSLCRGKTKKKKRNSLTLFVTRFNTATGKDTAPSINPISPLSAITHYTLLHTSAGCSEVVRLWTHCALSINRIGVCY